MGHPIEDYSNIISHQPTNIPSFIRLLEAKINRKSLDCDRKSIQKPNIMSKYTQNSFRKSHFISHFNRFLPPMYPPKTGHMIETNKPSVSPGIRSELKVRKIRTRGYDES